MCKIASALRNTCSLKHLDISDNNVGSDAAREIATALFQNDKLQGLYMSKNDIKPQDLVTIAQSLLNTSTLTLFSVAGNNMGDEACSWQNCRCFVTQNIQHLYLSGNGIKTAGAIKIAKALQKPYRI